MITIWKYPLAPDVTDHKLPRGARFLSVQAQDGDARRWGVEGTGVFMWFLVDTDSELQRRRFIVYGTGHEVRAEDGTLSLTHLGTFQFPGLVLHAFEIHAPLNRL